MWIARLYSYACFSFVYGKIIDKRYEKFEKEITSPVFYKANGNFYKNDGGIKNGNIYFCEDGIVCVCLEDKPYTVVEILQQNIDHYRYTSTQLSIWTNDGRVYVLTLAKIDEIIEKLIDKGWIEPKE